MAKDIRALLEGARGKWTDTEIRSRQMLDDGNYQFEIQKVKDRGIIVEDNDGAVRARVRLFVLAGPTPEMVGKATTKSWTLIDSDGEPDAVGMSILKTELTALGVPVGFAIDTVGNVLEGLIGQAVNAVVATRTSEATGQKYQNVYINGPAGDVPAAPKAPGAEAPAAGATGRMPT